MGVTCLKKTNRWLHLDMVVDFILKYNSRITSYIAHRPNNAARPPVLTPTFWIITAAVTPAIAHMNRTFVELQDRSLIISQQRGFLDSMLTDLVVLFSIKDARTDAHVLRVLCEYAVKLIIGLQKMQAECDEINHAAVLEAPECMPVDLAKMHLKLFRDDILTPRLARVRLFFSADDFHRPGSSRPGQGVQGRAQHQGHHRCTQQQNEFQRRLEFYRQLPRFCAGMASVFVNKTSVESDFSILKWEKDEFRMNLLDLSLEGIFQAKQFKLLGLLDPNPVPQADDDDDDYA
ncbi:hypothetical protein DYB36_000361 [Aphanomyces astaci]|uniref:Uncharacterized protein n=1 Tax=Aphanomyces astaci TaxID=112090 RepID=A0A397ALQ0_APHAT|nr:hypothetical protein DYB36_000361 [Aphanomyces astaci]